MSGEPPGKSNGSALGGLLQLAASSGDKWIQLAIIALVVLSGGGNFFTIVRTNQEAVALAQSERADLLKAVSEIHDVHAVLDSSITRQKEIHDHLDKIDAQLDRIEKLLTHKPPPSL